MNYKGDDKMIYGEYKLAVIIIMLIVLALGSAIHASILTARVEALNQELEDKSVEIERLKQMVNTKKSYESTLSQIQWYLKDAQQVLQKHNQWNIAEGIVTAYSPFDNVSGIENDGNPNYTATGTKPGPGTIAVDPKRIPYGSEIIIIYEDGTIEMGKALDTGATMRRAKDIWIDVYRDTYQETVKHGKKKAIILWK